MPIISLRGVVANVMNNNTVMSEFELQSRYYVHFRANAQRKGGNPSLFQLWVK